jgi:hypothetical protein
VKHPSTKLQRPENIQASGPKPGDVWQSLDVEVWSFSGAWMLELGIFAALPEAFYL